MAIIRDTMILGPDELEIIQQQYPQCKITRINGAHYLLKHFVVTIEGEKEENYFNFLVDNDIAMSSGLFHAKVRSDDEFKGRMKSRFCDHIEMRKTNH